LTNDLDMKELFDDVSIARQQDPDVAPGAQCAGQGRRNGREAAHSDKVIHLRGDEQYFQEMPSCQR
jgi:hypothetical protein